QVGGGSGQRGGDGGGVAELVATGGGGAGGVPHGAGGELAGHGHVGAVVLDRLVHGDGAAELLALLGVGGRHVGGLLGEAGGLGRQDHPGQVREQAGGAGEHGGGGAVEGD